MNDPMKNKLENDPSVILHAGIEALTHPDVPQHIKDAAAPHLFAAKHYGMQGLTPPDDYHVRWDQGAKHGN